MPGDEQGISLPLGLFSSLDTELFPPPEGLSPDCQDVIYAPQSVSSREGLHKIFAAAIPGNPAIVYVKTYIQPNGQPLTLILDANGTLWKEDVANFPGVPVQIALLPLNAGSTAILGQSVSAFGREYIATSDGQHGIGAPLQYDGVNLDRVSQDGPGSAVAVSDELVSVTIQAAATGLTALGNFTIVSGSETDSLVTLVLAGASAGNTAASFKVGDAWLMAGIGAGYNGTFSLATCVQIGPNLSISYISTTTGLAPVGAGGTASTPYYNVMNAGGVTTRPPVGASVAIVGAGVAGYNGTWVVRILSSVGVFVVCIPNQFALAASGGGTWSTAGNISVGIHQCVVLFQTRNGFITAPSPVAFWTAAGGKRVIVSNLPIGPPNVIARILAFTGAGGANFFYVPVPITIQNVGLAATVIPSTVVPDNSSSTVTIDFADNILFAATAIDISGRNYFANVVLGGCLGFFFYASRLFAWGEYNKIQNLFNLGFEGGFLASAPTLPSGPWVNDSAGGTLMNGGSFPSGQVWQIAGAGSGLGRLSQSAYQDRNGIAILQPNTLYSIRAVVKLNVSFSGSFPSADFEIFSPTTGFSTVCSISASTAGSFLTANFPAATPATIPSDLTFRFSGSGMHVGAPAQNIQIDEIQVFPTLIPFRTSLARGSYFQAGEQFDGVTGDIGPTDDSSQILAMAQIRGSLLFDTEDGKHSTNDNATGEPSTWDIKPVTESAGVFGVHASDPGRKGSGDSGEQWEFFAGPGGLYIYSGGETLKISQEIQGLWNRINLAKKNLVWVKNDFVARRCYVGVPLDSSAFRNRLFVLDYNNLNDAAAIANTGPIRESMQGKLVCREFSRKWTPWNLELDSADLITRPNNIVEMCFGSGHGGTGFGNPSFGNFYFLDPAKLTDDDYGLIVPYYDTYLFGTPDQEQQYQLGHHKLATYLVADLQGIGRAAIVPYANTLENTFPALPAYPLSPTQSHDLEWDMNVDGERIGVRIGSSPANGSYAVASAVVTIGGASSTAEFFLSEPLGLAVGQSFVYAGLSSPELNGTWTITAVNSPYDVVATAAVVALTGDTVTGGTATVSGLTDNSFHLQSLAMTLKTNPMAPLRGAF